MRLEINAIKTRGTRGGRGDVRLYDILRWSAGSFRVSHSLEVKAGRAQRKRSVYLAERVPTILLVPQQRLFTSGCSLSSRSHGKGGVIQRASLAPRPTRGEGVARDPHARRGETRGQLSGKENITQFGVFVRFISVVRSPVRHLEVLPVAHYALRGVAAQRCSTRKRLACCKAAKQGPCNETELSHS